jgi:glycosyltransferase involved in cell wall biosynthesis
MKISIGILAYNESSIIDETLKSLLKQSLFNKANADYDVIEILVVPNGCTDETAEVATKTLKELVNKSDYPEVQWKVCEVEQAGKSNAWNLYVHQFSNQEVDYIFLMDADIEFLEVNTLSYMVESLEKNPQFWVTVDNPVKDVALKENKSLMDRLSLQGSQVYNHSICGQLYCSRANKLREIWLPSGLPVEDGFIRAMVLTDHFTGSEVFERIENLSEVSHVFEAETNFGSWMRHEKRLVIGSTINSFIYGYLWDSCSPELKAGALIKMNNEKNPLWVEELIQQSIVEKQGWVIPPVFLFRRWRNFKNYSPIKKLIRFPITIMAFLADWIIFIQANNEIKEGRSIGYW